jgi:hypothetical protein
MDTAGNVRERKWSEPSPSWRYERRGQNAASVQVATPIIVAPIRSSAERIIDYDNKETSELTRRL